MDVIPKVDNSKNMPSARANGVLIPYIPEKNKYLLIGGSDRTQAYNDIWILNMEEKNWEKIENIPKFSEKYTPRIGVAFSVISNTPNKIVLYINGGQDFFTQTFFSDMLILEINKEKINESSIKNNTILPLDLTKNPSERNSHCMLYEESKNKIFIFGGGCKDYLLNDFWEYDLSRNEYQKLQIYNLEALIQPRELFGMIYYENKIFIFGGRLMDEIDKNSYIIDLENKSVKLGGKLPYGLCAFAYTKIKYENESYIVLYGGTDGNMFSNNFFVYNFKDDTFKKSNYIINKDLVNNDPNFSVFLGRISAMMTYDEKGGNIIIYGGSAVDKEWNYVNQVKIKDIFDGL